MEDNKLKLEEAQAKLIYETKMARMLHAIGFNNRDRSNPWSYSAYRNYSVYSEPVKEWEQLVEEGLAEKFESNREVVYRVSKKGFQEIANYTQMNISITLEFEPDRSIPR